MRLWLLLLALAPWAGAADWARPAAAPRAVQLSLDFSARPALSAPSLSLAPALAAPPALTPPAAVAQALKAGDPVAFYKAAVAAEYEVPEGDDHQERLFREGFEREEADRAFWELAADPGKTVREAKSRARKTKLDYDEFGRLLALTPRLSLSAFQDIEPKRRILKAAGYTHLTGPGGKRIPIELADDIRVGRAFEHTRAAFERR